VIPLHFVLIPSAIAVGALLVRRAPRVATVIFALMALASVVAQIEFQSTAYKHVARHSNISHASAWRLILDTARECRAAGLPLPNVPLDVLTQEFDKSSISTFDGLLRRSLGLAPAEPLHTIAWEQHRADGVEAYHNIPSLRLLERKLLLHTTAAAEP
jgi:hypothetical protein